MAQVVVIEDDADLRTMLRMALREYHVRAFERAEDALFFMETHPPDLLILDWMLPGMDGLQILRYIRQHPRLGVVPVLMLTARTHEEDVVSALREGADDYVRKPFSIRELLARIEALLRRNSETRSSKHWLRSGDLLLDEDEKTAYLSGKALNLTPMEFQILNLLLHNARHVLSREYILSALGVVGDVTPRTVDVHIRHLRKKLGAYGSYIETKRGFGYRWNGPS